MAFEGKIIAQAALKGAARSVPGQLEYIRRLCSVDCGTGNLEGNHEVCRIIEDMLSPISGLSVERRPTESGDCLVARLRPENARGKIIISAHMDTVFGEGDVRRYPFTIDGDWAHGLGAADCKGGIAVSVYAVRIMQEAGMLPEKEIAFVFGCDEETGSFAGREIFRQEAENADMAFVFEPAREENGVITARYGYALCDIRVHGIEAHAGLRYEEGRSATVELADKILRLYRKNDPAAGIFYNVGPLKGSEGCGTVAGFASAQAGVCLPAADSFARVTADLKSLEKEVLLDGCRIETDCSMLFPPMERTEENRKLYARVREAAGLFGVSLPEQFSSGSSDACHYSSMGIPVVCGLGPYMKDIHTVRERLYIPSIAEKTQTFCAVLGML